jgi:DNA-binding PadR family transcriptional regulator
LEEVETYLPLSEVTSYILLSLAPGPRHGYAIMKDVQALSKERVILSTGTLYGAIKRLLEQEWIERVDDPYANSSGRQRKVYRLTELGRSILKGRGPADGPSDYRRPIETGRRTGLVSGSGRKFNVRNGLGQGL